MNVRKLTVTSEKFSDTGVRIRISVRTTTEVPPKKTNIKPPNHVPVKAKRWPEVLQHNHNKSLLMKGERFLAKPRFG